MLWLWKQLSGRLRHDRLAVLVQGAELNRSLALLAAERNGVARADHAREPAAQPAQAPRLAGDPREESHLQHAVRDDPREPDRARELVVEVDRVPIAGRGGVRGDLLLRERDDELAHEPGPRMTKRARERQTGSSPAVTSVSNVMKRMPRRSTSAATRPREVTVSPTSGWRSQANSCSACSRLAKSTAASSSSKSWTAVVPSA